KESEDMMSKYACGFLVAASCAILAPISVHADEPNAQQLTQPMVVPSPAPAGTSLAPVAALVAVAPEKAHKRPILDYFANHGCCGSDPYNVGCGSLKSEWIFLFGSCRTFYGEPCYRKAYRPVE